MFMKYYGIVIYIYFVYIKWKRITHLSVCLGHKFTHTHTHTLPRGLEGSLPNMIIDNSYQ